MVQELQASKKPQKNGVGTSIKQKKNIEKMVKELQLRKTKEKMVKELQLSKKPWKKWFRNFKQAKNHR